MLMRRCPARSLTIVGDFAQAGSSTTIQSWDDALTPLVGDRYAHHTLTVNYRTTAEILSAAAPLLKRVAPQQQTSRSIRRGKHPRAISIIESAVDSTIRDLVTQTADARPEELIGVIGPSHRTAKLTAVLGDTSAVVIAAPTPAGSSSTPCLSIDPTGIETTRHGGTRDLYVALTRATKRLTRSTSQRQTRCLDARRHGDHETVDTPRPPTSGKSPLRHDR